MNAALHLYSTFAGQPARIERNSAGWGGGVYIEPDGGTPMLCLAGGGINANSGIGSAIYTEDAGTSYVYADSLASTCGGAAGTSGQRHHSIPTALLDPPRVARWIQIAFPASDRELVRASETQREQSSFQARREEGQLEMPWRNGPVDA